MSQIVQIAETKKQVYLTTLTLGGIFLKLDLVLEVDPEMKKVFSIMLIAASVLGFFHTWTSVQIMLASPEGLAWSAQVMAVFILSLTSLLCGVYLYRRRHPRQMLD